MPILKYSTLDAANEGTWMTIVDPETGASMYENDEPVRLKLAGSDSKIYQKFESDLQNLLMSRAIKKNNRVIMPKLSSEESKERDLKLAVALTLDWSNVILKEGESPAPFTKENVELVYKQVPDILDQVKEFVENRSNFLKK